MKLAYRDVPASAPGRPAIVLHDRGMASVARVTALAQASGAVGRVVAPFGDYGFTASGMELAGICWYRTVPGFAGGDPLTLAKAVVQVGDLLDDVDLDRPALLGWGEGAVVALGAALLRPDRVASVMGIDAQASHLDALPAGLTGPASPPPVLLMGRAEDHDAGPERAGACLGRRGITASTWDWPGGGSEEDRDKAMAERIGRWLEDG
jgi:pimeloyl-ACP methyl ester carboxylesterase